MSYTKLNFTAGCRPGAAAFEHAVSHVMVTGGIASLGLIGHCD
jgi:hypothetical protein